MNKEKYIKLKPLVQLQPITTGAWVLSNIPQNVLFVNNNDKNDLKYKIILCSNLKLNETM
jgi:hypothetical protein